MATLAQIRAAIKAKLAGVANIGVVHDYERFAARENDFQALYKDVPSGRLLGWNFSRASTAELDLNNREVRRIHSWSIRGLMSMDDADASEKLFDTLVESVATAFRADPTLGGLCDANKNLDQDFGPSGIQIDATEPVMFAGILCHRARLTLITETTESY